MAEADYIKPIGTVFNELFDNDGFGNLRGYTRTNVQDGEVFTADFTQDPSNNRLEQADFGTYSGSLSTGSWTYDDYAYDAEGRMTTGNRKLGPVVDTTSQSYDDFGNMTRYEATGHRIRNLHNMAGLRYAKRRVTALDVNLSVTYQIYSGSSAGSALLRTFTVNLANDQVSPSETFYYGALGLEQKTVHDYSGAVNEREVIVADHLGTPQVSVDLATLDKRYVETLAYGAPLPTSSSLDVESPLQAVSGNIVSDHFTGHQYDTDSNFHNMHLRMYDSEIGRFTRPDPALDIHMGSPGSWNLYAYVGNNPVNRTDPTGGQMGEAMIEQVDGMTVSVYRWGPPQREPLTLSLGTLKMREAANSVWYQVGITQGLRYGAVAVAGTAMVGVTMIPGVGEAMDIYACATGGVADCAMSGASLAMSAVSGGFTPNASAAIFTARFASSLPDIARGVDVVVDGVRGARASQSTLTAGKNFKSHFGRARSYVQEALDVKIGKLKAGGGDELLSAIGKGIDDGLFESAGQGTLRKGGEVMNIYRGQGLTVVTKHSGEFVTVLKSGEGKDLAIQSVL